MIAASANRDLRPVGVLLGGSGRARPPALRTRVVPALLKPSPHAFVQSGMPCGRHLAQC